MCVKTAWLLGPFSLCYVKAEAVVCFYCSLSVCQQDYANTTKPNVKKPGAMMLLFSIRIIGGGFLNNLVAKLNAISQRSHANIFSMLP